MLKSTKFHIYVNATPSVLEPILLISSPSDLEKVWNQQLGFTIHSYNLKATFSSFHSSDIKFYISKYLQHGFIFHLKEQKVVRAFTQEDVNEQFIVLILKHGSSTHDYFTFQIAVDKVTFRKEYRMDFQWAVVFFPFPEYSVCEDAVALNIEIYRKGNTNISSYVTIASIEQTAKEGLDFVSRRINKIQFDPGITSTVWKIMIVQDDLEEAPIEQLQVILSDSENCLIDQNRTILSIYDLDRGACSQIPIESPQKHKLDRSGIPKNVNSDFDSDEAFDDHDDYESSAGFPKVCDQNIYGLLHFNQSTQSLFQCNGKKWLPWIPKNLSSTIDLEYLPVPHSNDSDKQDKTDYIRTATEILFSKDTESTSEVPEVEYCNKGWEEYYGKCHKWHRQPITWTDAQKVCNGYTSGELVAVESLDHNNWLLQLARGKPYWIGLHASLKTNEWMYDMSNDVPFENWKKGFPRLPVNGEMKHRCVLVRGSGHWINKNCDLHDHSYVCSIPLNTLS